jgi:hypothetical protein
MDHCETTTKLGAALRALIQLPFRPISTVDDHLKELRVAFRCESSESCAKKVGLQNPNCASADIL